MYKVYVQDTNTEEDAKIIDIPNRGCRFYEENNLKYYKKYSESACENECLIKAQIKVCKCVLHTLVSELGFYTPLFDNEVTWLL